jgi:hypothetical protein
MVKEVIRNMRKSEIEYYKAIRQREKEETKEYEKDPVAYIIRQYKLKSKTQNKGLKNPKLK